MGIDVFGRGTYGDGQWTVGFKTFPLDEWQCGFLIYFPDIISWFFKIRLSSSVCSSLRCMCRLTRASFLSCITKIIKTIKIDKSSNRRGFVMDLIRKGWIEIFVLCLNMIRVKAYQKEPIFRFNSFSES